MPPGGVRLPVPPGVPPPTFGEVKPPLEEPPIPLEEPPSPLEGAVSGIEPVPVVPFEPSEALEPLPALEPVEEVEALEVLEALEPLEFVEAPPVVVLFSPPVVAVCERMPSDRPRKTALIILSSRSATCVRRRRYESATSHFATSHLVESPARCPPPSSPPRA
jgi:hypothetical protein